MTSATDMYSGGTTDRVVQVVMCDETYQALLALCAAQGWRFDEGLHVAVEYGAHALRDASDLLTLGEGQRGVSETPEKLHDQIARLRAENDRLHEWIAQHKWLFPT